jgi:hypothetical protein
MLSFFNMKRIRSLDVSPLQVLRVMLILGLLGLAVAVVQGSYRVLFSDRLSTSVVVRPAADGQQMAELIEVAGQVRDDLRIDAVETTDRAVRIGVGLVDLGWAVIIAVVLVAVLRALRDTGHGRPFSRANVRRIEQGGWLVLIGCIVVGVADSFVDTWAQDRLGSATISTSIMLPLLPAFGLFVLGLVWQRGAELTELEEQTV